MSDGLIVLNARVGRISPRQEAERTRPAGAPSGSERIARLPLAAGLLGALALALWPHWAWMALRLSDGSDEPWGVLACATVLVLVGSEWRRLAVPPAAALLAGAFLAIAAAAARWWLPPLAAAVIAMGALASFLAAARPDRSTAPLATLLLLALPVIASLQFYFGYPLRVATAALAAPLIQLLGVEVHASGAALLHDGRIVLVDPPCAGIAMLWLGAYTAALLSYLNRAALSRTAMNGVVAAGCVFGANVARNVVLFFPEGLDLGWPAWTHAGIGLAAFALALLPIVWFAQRGARAPRRRLAWPQRHHRRVA